MRVVIDTNRLQADELRAFLAISSSHTAVLTDFNAVESFKGDALTNIQANMAVLRDYPGQIVMLRATGQNVALDPAIAAIGNRMIDRKQTKSMPDFFRALDRARDGWPNVRKQLRLRGTWAEQQLARMLGAPDEMPGILEEIASNFSAGELKTIRSGAAWTVPIKQTIMAMVINLAAELFQMSKPPLRHPQAKDRWNHFIYREALFQIIHLVLLIRSGARDRKPEKMRNDHIDHILGTYGTYFNGLMTDDMHLHQVQWYVTKILRDLSARVPPDYAAWLQQFNLAESAVHGDAS